MIMRKLQYFVFPAVAALALAATPMAFAAGEGANFDVISSGQASQPAATSTAGMPRLKPVIVRGQRLPSVDTASEDYNPAAQAQSLRTRAEVMAEVRAGNRNTPFLPNVSGEQMGPFFYASLAAEEKAYADKLVAERAQRALVAQR
jgi:hypothetical protein